jgi:iron-sulfur cluster assembly accessory protein
MGISETSIAGGLEGDSRRINGSWLGRVPPVPSNVDPGVAPNISPVAVTELQAQATTSAAPPLTETQSMAPQEKPVRKSRLRARKAAMTLTPTAVVHLRELLDQPEPKLIRVGVKDKGCSGSAYHLEYVDKPAAFDEQVEQDGVKVLIDSKALIKVIGSEMDWVEDKLSARFTFRNPNISKFSKSGVSYLMLTIIQRNNAVVEKASVSFRSMI